MEFLKLLGTIAGGVFSRIAAAELKAWAPSTVRWLTAIAVGKLPENQRERFAEEWERYLQDLPGDFAKVFRALGLIRAARAISAEFGPKRNSAIHQIVKRSIDLFFGVSSMVLFMPASFFIAVLVKMGSNGPIFVNLERIGRGGRPFRIRKFRTMYVDGHQRLMDHLSRNPYQREVLEQSHILLQDPRLTRVGRFLRNTSLDELPLVWNVVKGEMRWVGPRALLRAQTEQFDEHLAFSSEKPGITPAWELVWLEIKIMMVRGFDFVFSRRK